MLLDKLQADLIVAMKSRDKIRVDTLRFLISHIKKYEIDTYLPGSDKSLIEEDVIKIIKKQIKDRKESITAFKKGNRQDLVDRESAQLKILENYAPLDINEEEIRQTVKQTISKGETNFGKIMGQVMASFKGQADGSVVSKIVKEEII